MATRGDAARVPGDVPVMSDRAGAGLCCCTGTIACVEVLRFKFTGRDWFRAFMYRPQALHTVSPVGDRRHNGVCVVLQLLQDVSASPHTCCRFRSLPKNWHCTRILGNIPTDLPSNRRIHTFEGPGWELDGCCAGRRGRCLIDRYCILQGVVYLRPLVLGGCERFRMLMRLRS